MKSLARPLTLALALALPIPAAAQLALDADGDGVADAYDAYPCDPAAVASAFAPAQGLHGTLLFEDLWPVIGDTDYNDLVLTYNYIYKLDAAGRALSMRATFNARAVGGVIRNGLGLHLPVPVGQVASVTRAVGNQPAQALTPSTMDAELTVVLSQDIREFFGADPGPDQRHPHRGGPGRAGDGGRGGVHRAAGSSGRRGAVRRLRVPQQQPRPRDPPARVRGHRGHGHRAVRHRG
jgi:hypothetical protein